MLRAKLRQWLEPIRKNGVLDVSTALARGRVARVDKGLPVSWLITNRNDEIQSRQLSDGFYEFAELEQLYIDIGPQKNILDIGANIGNHAIFFSKRMNAEKIILVEPYPPAIRHLLVNVSLNFRDCFDLSFLGRAVGIKSGTGRTVAPTDFNIGLTQIDATEPGGTLIVTGDDILANRQIDLIKIDVEGMEIDVLAGLEATLSNQRPILYVEISQQNRERFFALIKRMRYSILRESQAYGSQSNFTLIPEKQA